MSLDRLFSLAGLLASTGWLTLAISAAFRWRRMIAWVPGLFIPATLAVAYAGLIAAYGHGAQGDFSSLTGVAALFRAPGLLLAGWIHYLAFDLLIGVMIVGRIDAERLPRVLLLLLLPLTFLFGPIGFLTFQAIRLIGWTLRDRQSRPATGPTLTSTEYRS